MTILCRCCKNYSDMSNNLDKIYADRIFEISGIRVFNNERFPKNICSTCIFDLNNAWLFQTKIINSHKSFEKDFGLKQNAAEDDSSDSWNTDTIQKIFVKSIETLKARDNNTQSNENILSSEKEQSNTENEKNVIYLKEEPNEIENDEEILFLQEEQSNIKNNKEIISSEEEQSNSENEKKVIILQEEHSNKKNDGEILSSEKYPNLIDHLKNRNIKIINKSSNPEYKCSLCKESYTSSKNFYNHLKNHKERLNDCMCLCEICGKFFVSKKTYEKHNSRVHKGEKKFKCEFCDKAFTEKVPLQIHIRIHTGENPYKCTYCDKSFNKSWTLTQHKRLHTNEKPYKCPHCSLSFRHNVSKKDHIRSKHSLLDLHSFKSK